MIYSEPETGSDCQGSYPFSCFGGCDVNTHEKYRNNRLFWENTWFNQEKTGQFSGLWLIMLFVPLFYLKRGGKRHQNAHKCPPNRSRRRIGMMGGFSGFFLVLTRFCCCGYVGVRIAYKNQITEGTIMRDCLCRYDYPVSTCNPPACCRFCWWKKIKKFCGPLSPKKNYFRIFQPTKTIISHSTAIMSVASGSTLPVDPGSAVLSLPGSRTARMLNR